MSKKILAMLLCLILAAGLIIPAGAATVKAENPSVDRCCHTLRVDPLDVNYVRPAYDGYLIELTPQRVADTFAYLDEHYVKNHPEQALMVYTGTAEDQENLKILAETITEGCTTAREKADAIDAWLMRNIRYDPATSAYASDTFYRREGNCLSYANLMMFLLRSLGIPAVVGDGWRGDMQESTVELFNYEGHAWCFVLLDGEWVLYDPLWIEGGTTDREYMARWIYFGTVEFVTPASDGDNLPPVAYDESVVYCTDGKYYMYSDFTPYGVGTLSMFVNNQAYIFVTNQCEGDISDGRYYMDGRDKSGMEQGEVYRDGWVSYGDYSQNGAMSMAYAFPNGMMPDGYVLELDGRDWYMSYDSAKPILMDEGDYWIQNGAVTVRPGYSGPFLGVEWQEGVLDSRYEYVVTWESWNPETVTVDQNGNITCLQEGYADIQIQLKRVEKNGNLSLLSGSMMTVLVSNEDRTPDYTDYPSHEHEYVFDYAVAATCEDWGYEAYKCTLCPYTDSFFTQEPLGHDYVRGICTRCGAEDSHWVPPEDSGTCGENLTWVLNQDGVLTISGSGAMYDYEYMETPWWDYLEDICRIVVQDGVTRIGQNAFREAVNLAEVSLRDTITEIGPWAFMGAEKLTAITLPQKLETLEQEAFRNCYSLKEIELPGTLTFIESPFDGCTSLKRAVIGYSPDIPSLVTTNSLFRGCTALEEIRVDGDHFALHVIDGALYVGYFWDLSLNQYPLGSKATDWVVAQGTRKIDQFALENAQFLETVTIPACVEHIGTYAFRDCHKLTTIYFEGNAPTVGEGVFEGVSATAYYPAGDATWTEAVRNSFGGDITWVANGVIASGWSGATQWTLTSDGTLTVYGQGNMKNYGYNGGQPWLGKGVDITSVVIEEGVAAIGTGAFKDLTTLKSVTLPDKGLTKIGEAAFYGCSALKEITIPEGIYTVWSYTFKGCTSLAKIKFPKTLIKVDQGAFENCTSLPYVYFPTNVEIIGSWSFKGCTGLTEADMTWTDATKIREGAFKNCSSLTTIRLPANIQTLGDSCFYGIGATSFTVPDTVTSIEAWCFARAYSLTKITFKGNAPTIGEGAFNKITLTAYYPRNNTTWKPAIMQNYGGTVTWTAN